jgi:hypothetical protein
MDYRDIKSAMLLLPKENKDRIKALKMVTTLWEYRVVKTALLPAFFSIGSISLFAQSRQKYGGKMI